MCRTIRSSIQWLVSAVLTATLPAMALSGEPSAGDGSQTERLFAKEVLPLLQRKCLACHGDDRDAIKGELDMRSRAGLLAGGESGEPSIVPGKPKQSPLYAAVRWDGLEMPPKENDRLSADEVASIQSWIAGGAPWPSPARIAELKNSAWSSESDGAVSVATSGGASRAWTNRKYDPADLWAYQQLSPVRVPWHALPDDRSRHPVDALIAARLQQADLSPANQAAAATTVRRIYYGLTGLPPTFQQLQAFARNPSNERWAQLVAELLESPHYGERMAQHWLDVVRYADTNGFARDEFRPKAWKYRDYVIESFNSDKPYDQFVREQIAGDELDPPQSMATGYLWMGPWEHTAMSVAAVTRQQWLDDVTNIVGVTFLAHELRCAKCHDHKFDPIPTRDYYRMQAAFASTRHHKGGGNYEVRTQHAQQVNILIGGALESPGEKVEPGVLSVVADDPLITTANSGRRRELAEWIASPDNPLTARVMVNRVWQMHFGRGLVHSANNFGKTGTGPTHPELLDWLAQWFIDNGWSIKKLHRLILTSETYRQSGQHPWPEVVARVDPENRLLSYFPPRRKTAEELRDSMLAASGELNLEVGGPSVYPEINREVAFQPRLLMGKIGPPYQPSPSKAERDRRTLYAVRIRGLRNPFLESFNQPSSEFSCERRDATTVAPQALTMLHGEFVHERTLALAEDMRQEHETKDKQIDGVFQAVLRRLPSPPEREMARAHIAKMTKLHRRNPVEPESLPTSVTLRSVEEKTGEPTEKTFQLKNYEAYQEDVKPWDVTPETRALADLGLVLFNSSEFLYVY